MGLSRKPRSTALNVFLSLVLAMGLLPVMPANALADDPAESGGALASGNVSAIETTDEGAEKTENAPAPTANAQIQALAETNEANGGTEESTEPSILGSGKNFNANWTVYSNGVMTFDKVEGSDGAVWSTSMWSTPPYAANYGDAITSIVIGEGITSMGSFIFNGLSKVTSVTLPASLTEISSSTFYGCDAITSFTCAEGGAFSVNGNYLLSDSGKKLERVIDKSLLKGTVTLPDGVTTIDDQFSNAVDMTAIILPSSLTTVGYASFSGCTGLTEITLPCNVPSTDGLFQGCTNLEKITFAEGVTSVLGGGLINLEKLTTMNFPSTLTELNGGIISNYVTTVTFAEGGVFSENNGVVTKTTEDGTEIVKALASANVTDDAGMLTIPEGTVSLGSYAYGNNASIKSIVFPSTLKTIGNNAFYQCANLAGELVIPEGVTTLGDYAFFNTGITKATIPAGVTSMGGQMFSSCDNLKEMVIGSNMSGDPGAESVETITFTEGVTSVTNFWLPESLLTINVPASIETFVPSAGSWGEYKLAAINCAEGCKYSFEQGMLSDTTAHTVTFALPTLTGEVSIPDGTVAISDGAFNGNSGITSVTFPASLTTIGESAFEGCDGLTSVSFPANLTTIGESAFNECTGLTGELTIPATVTTLGDQAFYGCSALTKLTCASPATATEITYGKRAFRDCTSLAQVTLPEGLTTYNQLFYGCSAISSLTLPESVTSISSSGENFRDMTGLTNITLPSVTTLYRWDFNGCTNLTTVDLPKATTLSDFTFAKVGNNLKEIYLSKDLTTFGRGNFTYPAFIYYTGSQDNWNSISFADGVLDNIAKYNTTVVCNYKASAEPLTITAQPTDITSYKGLPSNSTLVSVEIPEGSTAYYYWYGENGACVAAGPEPTFSITSTTVGTAKYYCVAKAVAADGTVRSATSNEFTLTTADTDGLFEGEGTEAAPYLLKTAQDMTTLATLVNNGLSYEGSFFKMDANIELPAGWVPIGATKDGGFDISAGKNLNAFKGTFDGGSADGYTLTVPAGEKPLFNYVWGATIKNLNIYGTQIAGFGLIDKWTGVDLSGVGVTIDNVTLKSGTSTLKSGLLGGVTGTMYACVSAAYVANISNCTIEEGVTIGYDGTQKEIGSIAGRFQGTMENCVSYATVKGTEYVGGLVGTRDNAMGVSVVHNCTFGGAVEASGQLAGGIVGGGYDNSTAPNGARPTINNCTVTGTITGTKYVGGILGGDLYVAQPWDNVASSISNNSFTGKVSGTECVGAIVGFMDSMNRCDTIEGNKFAYGCGADKAFAFVKYLDTSYANPTLMDGTIAFSTESNVNDCPSVTGCGWQVGYNRTDDPLGADADKLAKMMTYFEVSTSLASAAPVKVGDVVTVDVTVRANDGIAALAGTLDYDPAQFELVNVTKGAGLSKDASFLPAEGAAEAAFSFYGNKASAAGEEGIVVATATLKALAASEGATVSVKDATASLEGDPADYQATVGSAASVTILANALLGDANGNGRVNIVDAQVIYDMGCGRYGVDYANLALPAAWTRATLLWAANVNGDDAIDAADAFATQYFVHYGTWGERA